MSLGGQPDSARFLAECTMSGISIKAIASSGARSSFTNSSKRQRTRRSNSVITGFLSDFVATYGSVGFP